MQRSFTNGINRRTGYYQMSQLKGVVVLCEHAVTINVFDMKLSYKDKDDEVHYDCYECFTCYNS